MKPVQDPYETLALHPELLNEVPEFDWLIKAIALGENPGKKNSLRLGTGLEFSQYRPYSQGDDLRALDWKMYARTDRFFIKQSEVESNIAITFIIDQSASMHYEESGLSKQQFAKLLTGLMAHLSSEMGDKYGLAGINPADPGLLPATGNRHWFRFLQQLIVLPESATFVRPNIPKLTEKELFVVITDLYGSSAEWPSFIQSLKTRKNEVIVFHLMGQQELLLDFNGTILFQDLESDREIKITPQKLAESYGETIQAWIRELRQSFLLSGIDYHQLVINDPIGGALQQFIWHRKKLM